MLDADEETLLAHSKEALVADCSAESAQDRHRCSIGGRRHRRVCWSTGASAEAREPCQVKGIAAACVQWADDSGLSVSLAELTTLSRTQFLSMLSSSVCDWSPDPKFCPLIGPLLQVSSHLSRLEGGGDLGPAPATAGLLGLLR